MSIWTDDELLTLDPLRQRADTFRFDLLDPALTVTGVLSPDRTSVPQIRNDTGNTIMRTMTGMRLDVTQTADVNPLADRVRPMMILENGSEYPLGVFLFTDDPRKVETFGEWIDNASLSDQWLILDQPLAAGVSFAVGANLTDALESLVLGAGIASASIETTSATLKDPLAYEIGRNRTEAVKAIAAAAGFVCYFDNSGTFVARTPPDLETAVPDFTYGPGGTVAKGSVAVGNDLLNAPNLFIVISTNSREVPVVGRYEVPASAPHSFVQRGFYITRVIPLQGITTQAEADLAARSAAADDQGGYEWASFTTTMDPRHDTYNTVAFNGETYRETSWGPVPLISGGTMPHALRKVYGSG